MIFIDSHAHIYLAEFDEDRENLIQRSKEAGVKKILMPAIDSGTHEKMLTVEKNFDSCISMMGLHPCSVKENFEEELKLVEDYFSERKFIAVGEIGLDFYWDKTFANLQYEAFHRQISLALKNEVPIVIHSRNAIDECIDVVKQYPQLMGVFHCFSGNIDQAFAALETNFYLGIGGVVTFKNSGLDKVVAATGIKKLILETDAPYLAPVPFRGKRNQPDYTTLVAEKVATILNLSLDEVAQTTTDNSLSLFNLTN